jgi:hypothetical protein
MVKSLTSCQWGYRPLAENCCSHITITDPFSIEMGEILPGSLQPQYLSSVGSLVAGLSLSIGEHWIHIHRAWVLAYSQYRSIGKSG